LSTKFESITTAELSFVEDKPYSTVYNDIYFSCENGLQESLYVFFEKNQLIARWEQLTQEDGAQFIIGETGFGSGLNFLLAWSLWEKYAPTDARLHYITCEKHPLSRQDLERCLSLWPQLSNYAHDLLVAYPVLTPGYHRLEFLEGRVILTLMLGAALPCYQDLLLCGDPVLEATLRNTFVDAWFLDGFSPKKNPEIWSDELFITLAQLSRRGTTLSTFSSAGAVKRGLLAAGFDVIKQKGYGSKREMLVATWREAPVARLKRKTPWHVAEPKTVKNKTAIVIGAGLSGCCVARALACRGWQVNLLERGVALGEGGSGVQQAVIFPNLSSYTSPLTAFMLSAFLFANRFYKHHLKQAHLGELSGILQLVGDKPDKLAEWLLAYPELGRLVDATVASKLAGVEILSNALFIPLAGWVDPTALSSQFIQHPLIRFYSNTDAQSLEYDSGLWHVAGHSAEVVVLANGYLANQFTQSQYFPMEPIRGQMTEIKASKLSQRLRIPICGDGHILPTKNGHHLLGATFQRGLTDKACFLVDDEWTLSKINKLNANLQLKNEVTSSWAGVRAGTPDRLPLVGPVANSVRFKQEFASLASDSKRWVGHAGNYHEGLYSCSGFGARGVTTIPLSAEHLASLINQEVSSLSCGLIQAISPARFLFRELRRHNS
jgi:tRNA 5-methylaminomethyl-2-thiouridine biosynthesis bifunctional protein